MTPKRVFLFARNSGLDDPRTFLSRLAGLLKYDLTARGGRCRLDAVAAAMGHREATIRHGIQWWVERGQFEMLAQETGVWVLGPGQGQASPLTDTLYRELQSLLAETAAYRAYFRGADAGALISSSDR